TPVTLECAPPAPPLRARTARHAASASGAATPRARLLPAPPDDRPAPATPDHRRGVRGSPPAAPRPCPSLLPTTSQRPARERKARGAVVECGGIAVFVFSGVREEEKQKR